MAVRFAAVVGTLLLGLASAMPAGEGTKPGVVVKITDEKPVVVEVESLLPIDPVQRIRYGQTNGLSAQINDEMGRNLHLSHFPTLRIDDQMLGQFNGTV